MKIKLLILIPLLLLACAKKAPQVVPTPPPPKVEAQPVPAQPLPPGAQITTTKTPGAPKWIDFPDTIPGIKGVGIQRMNALHDKGLQRKQAEAAARAELAKQLRIQIQGWSSDVSKSSSHGSSTDQSLVETASRVQQDVSREVLDVKLTGARVIQWWMDKPTDELYALMVLDPESVRGMEEAAKKVLTKDGLSDQDVDLALDKLDALLKPPTLPPTDRNGLKPTEVAPEE